MLVVEESPLSGGWAHTQDTWLLVAPLNGEPGFDTVTCHCGHSAAPLDAQLSPYHHVKMEPAPLLLWLLAFSVLDHRKQKGFCTQGWEPVEETSKSSFGASAPAGIPVGTMCFRIDPQIMLS